MRVDDTHMFTSDVQTAVLPTNPRHVFLEPQDTLDDVLGVLLDQPQSTLLSLPAGGDVFSRPEHFIAFEHALVERHHAPVVFVIPPQRNKDAALAAQYGFHSATSEKEALQSLARISFPALNNAASTTKTQHSTTTGALQEPPLPPSLPQRGASKRRVAGLFVLLLVVGSLITLPILFIPTTKPRATPAGATTVGTVSFLSSQQFDPGLTRGYNDRITGTLHGLPAPHAGMSYFAWLMPDKIDDATVPLQLGEFHSGQITINYNDPNHTDLLASYSGLRITEQPSGSTPDTPSLDPASWRWEGWVPSIPTPGDEKQYSLLSHLRHLLAQDPTLQDNHIPGGLALWLTRNTAKVEEWASAAQGQWHANLSQGDAALIHRHMLRMLEYLDGQFYYWRDVPSGSPWLVDQRAGKIGLLSYVQNQNPPGYLPHVDIHLTGLANSPEHTADQHRLAIQVDAVIRKMTTDLQQVRKDAVQLVQMNRVQLQQPGTLSVLNEMAALTTETKGGWLDQTTGENIGGVLWLISRLQQLASISIGVSMTDQHA